MATVYKVELEVVSDWVNYTPEDIKQALKERIETGIYDEIKLRVDSENIKVDRKS